MIQYILTDIEGTTTSVSFVYDTLFPYFKTHVRVFLTENHSLPEVKEQINSLKEEKGTELSLEEIVQQLLDWTNQDIKHPILKSLQGIVWKKGYEEGELKGHVYADVLPILEKWQQAGIQMGVYSSGSVAAQKLIFGKSILGNLNSFFAHNFDTKIGYKREVTSYQNIQQAIGIDASNILFLSDVEAELDAAQQASYQTIQLVREGTIASQKHPTVSDFSEINLHIF